MKTGLILCFLLFHTLLFSQNQVKGIIYGQENNKEKTPLPGANIYWLGTTQGTVSASNGEFFLQKPSNAHQLVVSFIGYANDTISILNEQTLNIILTAKQLLDEVLVEGNIQSTYLSKISPLTTHHISGKELHKAACCNLSESFETNASVDVSYTDAVTGAKQIELLGLAGTYTQILTENIPNLRGLAAAYGLGYIPGSWMESIQVSKGASSVVNGYESITGQINVEHKSPEKGEKLFFNALTNDMGQLEGNINSAIKVSDKWRTIILGHAQQNNMKVDKNKDSFMDAPLITQWTLFNKWSFQGNKGLEYKFGIKGLEEQRESGQLSYKKSLPFTTTNGYHIFLHTKNAEAFLKGGYVFPGHPNSSIALISNAIFHQKEGRFGLSTYDGVQKSAYGNIVYQSLIKTTSHQYSTGVSMVYDDFQEQLNDSIFNKKEVVPGVFFQYTYSYTDKLTLLAGIRGDYHNTYGSFFTPRLHGRYTLNKHHIIRGSVGKGYRTANLIADNMHVLASARTIVVEKDIKQEEAWNYGINLSKYIDIVGKELTINAEFYRTDFQEQVIMDIDKDIQHIYFYNLQGKSFSNSYQIEVLYELIKNLDIILAYRISDVQYTQNEELKKKPLVNRYKGLINLSYRTLNKKWQFDYTTQFNGPSLLPSTKNNPVIYQLPIESPAYSIVNLQVTKYFKYWNVYLGVENLTDFRQKNPIIAADNPYSDYFDASMVWGPIMGRKVYAGIRYKLEY